MDALVLIREYWNNSTAYTYTNIVLRVLILGVYYVYKKL